MHNKIQSLIEMISIAWQDSIADLLVKARLADWIEDTNSQSKKVVFYSGAKYQLI